MADVTWLDSLTALGVGPLLGAAVGFVGSGLLQWGTDKRVSEREREARLADREQRLRDERRAFEIATFERLPGLVQQCARSTVKILLFDLQTLEKPGRLTSSTPGNEDDMETRFALRIVADQVLDDDVREALVHLQDELWGMQTASNTAGLSVSELKAERTLQLQRVTQIVAEVSDKMSAYRRGLYK